MRKLHLLLGILLLTITVNAQINTFDLSSYKLPDIKRHQLDINAGLMVVINIMIPIKDWIVIILKNQMELVVILGLVIDSIEIVKITREINMLV